MLLTSALKIQGTNIRNNENENGPTIQGSEMQEMGKATTKRVL